LRDRSFFIQAERRNHIFVKDYNILSEIMTINVYRGCVMGRKKSFPIIGLAFLFVVGILVSTAAAQNVQVLDLSSQKLRDRVYASFIATQPVASWGKIVGTKNQAFELSAGEIIFVRLIPGANVKPGDRFVVGHLAQEVFLPGAKKKMGDLVVVAGEIMIVSAKEEIATARIEKSLSTFFAGDLVLSPFPNPPASIPIRSPKDIEGSILFSLEDSQNITDKEVVFIDRGRRDGLIPGDLFYVYQTGFFTEETMKAKVKLPEFKVGELVVVSVQEETSTALVTQSLQEIHIGDRVASGRK